MQVQPLHFRENPNRDSLGTFNLPIEIALMIIEQLDLKSLKNLEATSLGFYKIINCSPNIKNINLLVHMKLKQAILFNPSFINNIIERPACDPFFNDHEAMKLALICHRVDLALLLLEIQLPKLKPRI